MNEVGGTVRCSQDSSLSSIASIISVKRVKCNMC